MALHPSEFDLERASSGERLTFLGRPLARHLESCQRCSAAVEALHAERRAFHATRPSPEAFVAMLDRRRADARAPEPRRLPVDATTRPTLFAGFWSLAVAWATQLPRLQWWSVAAVCSVIALGVGVSPARRAPTAPQVSTMNAWTTKGSGLSMYVVRRRDHEQQLRRERIAITPGDELRLHFSLKTPARVAAGILVDNGTWVPFFERSFEAGSHTPAETIRVDDSPNSGTILFGTPDQVARARRGLHAPGLQTTELIWTAP